MMNIHVVTLSYRNILRITSLIKPQAKKWPVVGLYPSMENVETWDSVFLYLSEENRSQECTVDVALLGYNRNFCSNLDTKSGVCSIVRQKKCPFQKDNRNFKLIRNLVLRSRKPIVNFEIMKKIGDVNLYPKTVFIYPTNIRKKQNQRHYGVHEILIKKFYV